MELKSEKYMGFDIHFQNVWNDKGDRAVEVRIFKNGVDFDGTLKKSKQEGLDWAKDYLYLYEKMYGNKNLDAWKRIAKKELEQLLGVETRVVSYPYYDDLGAMSLESISGKANNGEREWIVFKNESESEKGAVQKVREDLENEPLLLFSPSFIENYIDEEKLRNVLEDDYRDDANEYFRDIGGESDDTYGSRDIKELIENGFLEEKESWNNRIDTRYLYGNTDEYVTALENAIEKRVKDDLNDNQLEYIKDMMDGDEEGIKRAIELGGVDIDEASKDAVDIDGVAHFLDGYDGKEEDLPSGAVAYGTN